MKALIRFDNHAPRPIEMPFREFIDSSGFRSRIHPAWSGTPEEVLTDHLPPFDSGDDEELCAAVCEACEIATDSETSRLRLDAEDLRFVRRRLLPLAFAAPPVSTPPDAA